VSAPQLRRSSRAVPGRRPAPDVLGAHPAAAPRLWPWAARVGLEPSRSFW